MGNSEGPQITHVDQTDNAAAVAFKDESKVTVYPASLLHAAKGLADIMHEKDLQEEKKTTEE